MKSFLHIPQSKRVKESKTCPFSLRLYHGLVWFYDDQKNNTFCNVNLFDLFLNDVLFFCGWFWSKC